MNDYVLTLYDDKSLKSEIPYSLEKGCFICVGEGIVWNSSISNWPVYICEKKYIFEQDPIDIYQSRENNFFFVLNTINEENIYYSDIEETSIGKLSKDNLFVLQTTNPDIYQKFLIEKTKTDF
jgi:hypothetical protein